MGIGFVVLLYVNCGTYDGKGAFVFTDSDDSKLESCSYMLKGVHLLLGEPLDFGFSFAMDIFHKVN